MPEIAQGDVLSEQLRRSLIAGDLLDALDARTSVGAAESAKARGFQSEGPLSVIVEANCKFPGGASHARLLIALLFLRQMGFGPEAPEWQMLRPPHRPDDPDPVRFVEMPVFGAEDTVQFENSFWTDQYLFGSFCESTIRALAGAWVVVEGKKYPLIHKIWLNHAVSRFVYESGKTVKCDAARAAFAAAGEGVVWAVVDTGIDGSHYHFRRHGNLTLSDGLQHKDFTSAGNPLLDMDGHGTHVAGIIAGETIRAEPDAPASDRPRGLVVQQKIRTSDTEISEEEDDSQAVISGIAPRCKLVSLKVLETGQMGDVATLLAALGYIQQANSYGRDLRIHGVNLSLGYTFDARWFAAGQSPLCVEVNRLVKSGVVVVVAAGNSGYGTVQSLNLTTERASHLATISDPGNADLAITVGSTHRDSPHTFGISYFSAKGPTADGRMKPDVVAPGERIVSAAPSDPARADLALFKEDTGTSMAAPHVSGGIAAFLSVRREFRGRPDAVKTIFVQSATDLGRRPEFQGAGLIDVMRALQSV